MCNVTLPNRHHFEHQLALTPLFQIEKVHCNISYSSRPIKRREKQSEKYYFLRRNAIRDGGGRQTETPDYTFFTPLVPSPQRALNQPSLHLSSEQTASISIRNLSLYNNLLIIPFFNDTCLTFLHDVITQASRHALSLLFNIWPTCGFQNRALVMKCWLSSHLWPYDLRDLHFRSKFLAPNNLLIQIKWLPNLINDHP